MNHYQRHIGDYLKDTAHLSLLEHGVYTRLLDIYYTREGPLLDAEIARLIGARSKEERQALSGVLQEFFRMEEGVWRQARCDREIELFQGGEPERASRKANETERLKRHREERAKLFELIRAAGLHEDWNAPMTKLRNIVASLQRRGVAGAGALPDMPSATPPATLQQPLQETARATPATANHTPITNTNNQNTHASASTAGVRDGPAPPGVCVSMEKEVADAMRAAGMRSVDAGDPAIRELLGKGATVAMFTEAAAVAMGKGKGVQYAFGMVRNKLADVAAQPPASKVAVTLPSKPGRDPAIVKIEADAAITRTPTPEERQALRAAAKGQAVAS